MGYKPAYIWNGTAWDQIGNQAVASLNDYALLAPVVGQNITNTTLTSASINSASVSGTVTLSGSINDGTINRSLLSSNIIKAPEERFTVSASAAAGTVNFNCLDQGVLYYTTSASGNWTLNFRGDASTTLNSVLSTGDSFTAVFLATQGGTAYYPNAFQVDGISVTPKWPYGAAPAAGNINSIDTYSFCIIKTASATYTIIASAGTYK